MSTVFLHGGGDDPAWRAETFGRFAQAAQVQPAAPIVLVVVNKDQAERTAIVREYEAIFAGVGVPAEQLAALFVDPNTLLDRAMLEQLRPSGVFVCGGTTPEYYGALCRNAEWLAYLHETGIPYCGTSAGAAVAARNAILGGWQARRGGRDRAILYMGAAEGLNELTVQPGLALVPFAVDVHASQWGTLLRLIHAVDLELVPFGWALDEDTLLEANGSSMRLHGKGHAYHVRRLAQGGVAVTVHTAGDRTIDT